MKGKTKRWELNIKAPPTHLQHLQLCIIVINIRFNYFHIVLFQDTTR